MTAPKPPKPTTLDMEVALMEHVDHRRNLIIPNVYWSMFRYELDLLVVTKAGLGWEIEIKISKSDLKKDKEKYHGHQNSKISKLYFALPTHLLKHSDMVPERSGIFEVYYNEYYKQFRVKTIREAKITSEYRFSEKERNKLQRLGTMRILTMKRKLQRTIKKYKEESSSKK